ncbi:kinesin-like protein KIF19 [Amphiura filiformis]|uniref:kinesin-like protein KIF19 n=1 Tax=Amphiura filiformis TaxID=82378 RepID=UPI003B2190E5
MEMAASRMGRNQDWKDSQLTVVLRVRPLAHSEVECGNTHIAHTLEDNVVVLLDPMDDPDDVLRANRSREKHYVFDYAFDDAASQEEVYNKSTKSLIRSVTEGYNATVFAYGATGAGKTYTMLGNDDEPGIMARALNDLFHEMESKVEDSVFKVTMSYLEIYNEMIRDLLNPSSGYLDLREDASGNVQVAGISEVSTRSTSEVMSLLMHGNKERTQEPTAANKTSSRSHAVLQVTIKERNRVRTTHQSIRTGKLFMIDLAGSERASNTKNRGKRMIEGAHINRSLLALGNCINALCEGGKYVNYRDSKLTRLLKDALGGNCKTLMIANISPASFQFEESRNTLLYADRAKQIKMKIKANRTNVSYHIAQYTNIISELKQEIERLRKKIGEQDKGPRIADVHSEVEKAASEQDRAEMDRLRHRLMHNFQQQMELRQKMMEVENQKWEISVEASRHFSNIAEWEQEKARLASKQDNKDEFYQEMDNKLKENLQEKELDSYSNISDDSPEPEDIASARQELGQLMSEQSKLRTRQSELERKLEDIRKDAATLEEVLPKKVTTEEQGEILNMLCKVHELEVENTELKSSALIHKHNIQQNETMITKYERHRQLCDEIIQQQRTLMNKHDVHISSDLLSLYEQYTGAVFEDIHKLNTQSPIQHMEGIKATSMLNLRALQALQEQRDTDSPEKESTLIEPNNNKKSPKKHPPEPIDTKSVTNQPRVFNPSPRAHQLRQKADFSLYGVPKVQVDSPAPSTARQSTSLFDLSHDGKIPVSHTEGINQIHSMQNLKLNDSSPEHDKNRKEIVQNTKSIAAIAARKRTSQKHFDSHPAKMNLNEKTMMSLRSVYETSEPEMDTEFLSPSRLARHNRGHTMSSPFVLSSDNDDNISITTIERKVDTRVQYKGGVRRIGDKQLLEKRKRRTMSYDQPSYLPKPTQRSRVPISKTIRRGGASRASVMTNGQRTSKLKQPMVHHAGDQDAMSFRSISPAIPAVVHQIGVEKGKGQSIHKRLRGPASAYDSNHSTPQHKQRPLLGRRQLSTIPAQTRHSSLAVSGFTVQKRDRITGRKV